MVQLSAKNVIKIVQHAMGKVDLSVTHVLKVTSIESLKKLVDHFVLMAILRTRKKKLVMHVIKPVENVIILDLKAVLNAVLHVKTNSFIIKLVYKNVLHKPLK